MKVADRKTTDTPGRQALVAWLGDPAHKRTQRGLGVALQVGQGAVSEWVRGLGRPSVPKALCLFRLCDIPLDAWCTVDERKILDRAKRRGEPLMLLAAARKKQRREEQQLNIPGTEVA